MEWNGGQRGQRKKKEQEEQRPIAADSHVSAPSLIRPERICPFCTLERKLRVFLFRFPFGHNKAKIIHRETRRWRVIKGERGREREGEGKSGTTGREMDD